MFCSYDAETQTLSIGNKFSTLTESSLLLGSTSKANQASTIGQFGEGYKLATLAAVRDARNVIIYNYGAKQIWRPRFVQSKVYNAEILSFFIDDQHIWNKVPNNHLTITVEPICTILELRLCAHILLLTQQASKPDIAFLSRSNWIYSAFTS